MVQRSRKQRRNNYIRVSTHFTHSLLSSDSHLPHSRSDCTAPVEKQKLNTLKRTHSLIHSITPALTICGPVRVTELCIHLYPFVVGVGGSGQLNPRLILQHLSQIAMTLDPEVRCVAAPCPLFTLIFMRR